MMEDKKISFSAANVFPAKMLLDTELIKYCQEKKKILMRHVQLNLTNKCCFNCYFCSCSNRDRKLELSYDDIAEIMLKAKACGCKSVTITGGGEPLLHPKINEIINFLKENDIEVGLVTNAVKIENLKYIKTLKNITWLRISTSDYLEEQLKRIGLSLDRWFEKIKYYVEKGNNIDWAFSHVLSRRLNKYLIKKIVNFANENNFTHIRIVSDLLDLDCVTDMKIVHNALIAANIDDKLVVYQGRKEFTKGTKNCYISLLKTVIGPDGKLYPCCGTQYALKKPSRDYEKSMCFGNAKDIDKIFEQQKFFDGSKCYRCYYENYNWALGVLLSNIKHKNFI